MTPAQALKAATTEPLPCSEWRISLGAVVPGFTPTLSLLKAILLPHLRSFQEGKRRWVMKAGPRRWSTNQKHGENELSAPLKTLATDVLPR